MDNKGKTLVAICLFKTAPPFPQNNKIDKETVDMFHDSM